MKYAAVIEYSQDQEKVEAANAAARMQFRFVGADPMLAQVVRRPELLDAVASARRTGQPQRFEMVQRDETDRHFAGVAGPLGAGVLVSLHDFTDIKRMELARVDFLANASHELRTPLTSLSGFIETMRGLAARVEAGEAAAFKTAPHFAPRRRLDETRAARQPKLRWKPAL